MSVVLSTTQQMYQHFLHLQYDNKKNMIKISLEELNTLKLIPNRVLVRTINKQSETTVGSMKIRLDTGFSEEQHAPVTGVVISVPSTLIPENMPWETDMVLMPGDEVVYSYETCVYCMNPETGREFHDEENNQYLMVDYEDIFAAKRNGEVIPVNGYLLVEPLTEEVISAIKLPVEKSGKIGRVAITSPKNKRYFAAGKERTDVYDFNDPINPGDYVVFTKYSDLPLEYELHNSIDGAKQYFRMQRRDIYHVINPDKITGVKISLAR